MPHLVVHALDSQLAGHEPALAEGLTEAVVAVYGAWARELVEVRLVGLPAGRWTVGGEVADDPAPQVTFGIKEGVFARPDAPEVLGRLAAGVTEVVAALAPARRERVLVEFVPQSDERIALGGRLIGS